jgi:PAS domain S-box-containing protein
MPSSASRLSRRLRFVRHVASRREDELRAEAKAARDLLEQVLASLNDHIVVYDNEWRYTYVNDAAARVLGKTKEQLLGNSIWELFPSAVGNHYYQALHRARAERCAIAFENYYEPWDRWFDNRIYPLEDSVSVLAIDITERKQAEMALQEFNATLERLVGERTAELERSNQELAQFAYVISHDLKAPLRAINHLAQWIEQDARDSLPAPSQEHLARLQGRVQRMDKLLDDMLAFSRASSQRHAKEMVDTAALVRDIAEMQAPPPGFVVAAELPMPVFMAERVPLETTLRNLIGNAIKHHHAPARGRATVSAHRTGNWFEFAVADNGPGIEPDYHQRIFEIFSTLQPRDQVEGSGMGLSVVQKIVESRGGRVWVDSDLGRGAVFYFTWPAPHEEHPQAGPDFPPAAR